MDEKKSLWKVNSSSGKNILFLLFEVKESFAIHTNAVRNSMTGSMFPNICYLKTLEEVS